jgi:hypothetical protein
MDIHKYQWGPKYQLITRTVILTRVSYLSNRTKTDFIVLVSIYPLTSLILSTLFCNCQFSIVQLSLFLTFFFVWWIHDLISSVKRLLTKVFETRLKIIVQTIIHSLNPRDPTVGGRSTWRLCLRVQYVLTWEIIKTLFFFPSDTHPFI